jgi:hypothetical protein
MWSTEVVEIVECSDSLVGTAGAGSAAVACSVTAGAATEIDECSVMAATSLEAATGAAAGFCVCVLETDFDLRSLLRSRVIFVLRSRAALCERFLLGRDS